MAQKIGRATFPHMGKHQLVAKKLQKLKLPSDDYDLDLTYKDPRLLLFKDGKMHLLRKYLTTVPLEEMAVGEIYFLYSVFKNQTIREALASKFGKRHIGAIYSALESIATLRDPYGTHIHNVSEKELVSLSYNYLINGDDGAKYTAMTFIDIFHIVAPSVAEALMDTFFINADLSVGKRARSLLRKMYNITFRWDKVRSRPILHRAPDEYKSLCEKLIRRYFLNP